MTTRDLFESNEIAVFDDISGDHIGKVIAKNERFFAVVFGKNQNTWPFLTMEKAISFIESTRIKKQETKIKVPVIQNQLNLF
jgi:hypothetical protein